MILHNFDVAYLILSWSVVTEVKASCDLVNSKQYGHLKVVKGKSGDSQCLDSVLLERTNGERYCLAKNPNPAKKETLECLKSEARYLSETSDEGGKMVIIFEITITLHLLQSFSCYPVHSLYICLYILRGFNILKFLSCPISHHWNCFSLVNVWR